ncbi:uncharacterized protein LTR77_000494 [Saxophila tyrrhenica]|uniref:Uncharacterized protein n=1 Tax=Saxophila tyrrhenica TaxID=1690608 RepID=A0AAV9PSP1_9PEZI|nr:hypothetical protein LTR77_000494 [Saxophila tyrrhenica]
MASSSRVPSGAASGKAPKSPESFESLACRNAAAEILQSYEKLSWLAMQRCESLTQTRLHFQNIVAGFTDEDEAKMVDYKTDNTPRLKPGEEPRGSRKGKERMSSGGGGGGGDGVAGSSAQKTDKSRSKNDAGGGSTPGSASKKRKSGGGS